MKPRLPILLLALACSLGFGSAINSFADEKPVIYVPVPPYAGLVESLVGDLAEVRSIASENDDPHIFSPTPKELAKLSVGTIYFAADLPFEETLVTKLNESKSKVKIVSLVEGLERRYFGEGEHDCDHEHGHDHDDHAEHDHAEHDHAEHDHAEHDHAEHDHAEHDTMGTTNMTTATENLTHMSGFPLRTWLSRSAPSRLRLSRFSQPKKPSQRSKKIPASSSNSFETPIANSLRNSLLFAISRSMFTTEPLDISPTLTA